MERCFQNSLIQDIDYYRSHPVIHFDTLFQHYKYEIIAVFESKVYRRSDTAFKHYNFINAEGEAECKFWHNMSNHLLDEIPVFV